MGYPGARVSPLRPGTDHLPGRAVGAAGILALLASGVACGPPAGRARGPAATSLAVAPPIGASEAEGAATRALAPAEPLVVDPAAVAALRASGRLPGLDLSDAVLQPGLTTVALLDTSRAEARGMNAEGGVRRVILREGQRASTPIELRAEDCLTIVVHAGLGVLEVDAFIVAPAAPDGEILAMEAVGGPLAIVGGQVGCFRPRRSGPAEVAVVARRGEGPVLAAIFRAP